MSRNFGSNLGQLHFKIVLLGEGCVGKTSLVLRYVEDKFHEKHFSTIQASFLTKKINLEGQRVTLAIWDTAGQERFHALGPIYYRDSHAAILVYDITDQDSFVKVQNWVKELKRILGDKVILAIVGNKTDLDKERNVPADEASEYARSVGATHYQTSAKTNRGIEELFLDVTQQLLRVAESQNQLNSSANPTSNRNQEVVIVDDNPAPKKSCCG
ncbi:hypothetical protein GHT06_012783 [Daphnia sinensis]|uniref:Ras-related protein Rab-21 n=1 Tax=Daphnia sinensis TaxID=1820382 RepID=A0AAD5KWP9_9CRUS|nr:hypothetical protein GHT06_012783 [Daphnia sinensis]